MHDSAMRRDKPARLGGAHAGTALYHLEQMFADSAGNLTPAPSRLHVRARDAAASSSLRARRGGWQKRLPILPLSRVTCVAPVPAGNACRPAGERITWR